MVYHLLPALVPFLALLRLWGLAHFFLEVSHPCFLRIIIRTASSLRTETVPLARMADAAVAAGLGELCITDHCDLMDQDGGRVYGYNWPAAVSQFRETVPMFQGRLNLRLGLEFGVPHVDRTAAEQILSLPELDFVIGSVHNLSPARGGRDFYFVDYPDADACYAALDDYFASMSVLACTDLYDVLGHIIYPLRYMHTPVSLERYRETIRTILRKVVEGGRGIEINTYRGRTIADWQPILELYRDCGGEIVTVGSDAHLPEHVGLGISEACALLQQTGFRYLATYEKRKPELHRL